MTSEDIRMTSFEQVRKGYRIEDVDDFLMQVASEMERLEGERDGAYGEREPLARQLQQAQQERDAAVAEKEDVENKLYVLAAKVEEYRGQEETLKTALINAQRMGETVVHEAKQKAEQMLRDATGQTELLRQKAEREARNERDTLSNLINEVGRFKSTILNLYKQHIESLSALDNTTAHAEKVLAETDLDAEPELEFELSSKPKEEPVLGKAEPELPGKTESKTGSIPKQKAKGSGLFEGELLDD